MPSNLRQNIKQKLNGCSNELLHIMGVLADLGELHREHHPDITERYKVVFQLTLQVKELIDRFHDAA